MFRRIVVPLDGSPLAEKALLHVLQVASPSSTELVLVNVIETYRYSAATMEMAPIDVLSYVRSGIDAYMEEQRCQLEAQQYTVRTRILEGDAAEGILGVADAINADLILMTTHGRSGVARWALGSVAERVLHHAKQPVWLVRENTRVISWHDMRRILVPLDGTAAAEQVLDQAQGLAQQAGAELLLLRVVPELDDANRRILFENESTAQTTLASWRIHAEHYLADVAQSLQESGVSTRTLTTSGAPVRSMLDIVAAENVDCIVMATHARLGIDRLLQGSVAAEILRHCGCPMLLTRVQEPAVPAAPAPQLAAV